MEKSDKEINITEDKFTEEKMKYAINYLKNEKAADMDILSAELMKSHLHCSVEIYIHNTKKIWTDKQILKQWNK